MIPIGLIFAVYAVVLTGALGYLGVWFEGGYWIAITISLLIIIASYLVVTTNPYWSIAIC